ncbi:LexA family protein [Streptomyces sp. Tue6028]|uniref:LexA family protein n=1 Tax=Streptomyces sp. Tue6028 TaxID=2036037 RepID=UPI003D740583
MGHHKTDGLTATQQRILHYIRDTIEDTGDAPTMREISAAVGLRGPSTVQYQLGELEAKHAIVRERGRPRGIRLT